MNKTYLISGETLKTIGQGALGAMTFGAYHQYTTNKIMELNNEKVEIQHKYFMDKKLFLARMVKQMTFRWYL